MLGPTFPHIDLHWVSMISYIPGVTTGSPNNDPPCSADTERLPTRNPRKDYLTETFILSPLLCLLCSQYSIPDDILVFANEQVSVCVTKARKSSYADSKAHPHGGPWGDQLKSIPRVSAWYQAVLVGFTDRNMVRPLPHRRPELRARLTWKIQQTNLVDGELNRFGVGQPILPL